MREYEHNQFSKIKLVSTGTYMFIGKCILICAQVNFFDIYYIPIEIPTFFIVAEYLLLYFFFIFLLLLLQWSQYPPIYPPPSILPPPTPAPTVNSHTVVHGCGSFIHVLCLVPSPSFHYCPPTPSPLVTFRLLHVSMPVILFCLLVYFVH